MTPSLDEVAKASLDYQYGKRARRALDVLGSMLAPGEHVVTMAVADSGSRGLLAATSERLMFVAPKDDVVWIATYPEMSSGEVKDGPLRSKALVVEFGDSRPRAAFTNISPEKQAEKLLGAIQEPDLRYPDTMVHTAAESSSTTPTVALPGSASAAKSKLTLYWMNLLSFRLWWTSTLGALLLAMLASWLWDPFAEPVFFGVFALLLLTNLVGQPYHCPHCMKGLRSGASACHHCGREVAA